MTTYSTFFSSGLLAPRITRDDATPVLPSSSVAILASPVDPVDRQLNLAPTSHGLNSPCPKAPEAHSNAERSRTRKRRSSINVGSSPMALIKSPVVNAGAALQRSGLMSPARHRAASIGMNDACESNSFLGRLGSGNAGGIVNPPKRLRRAIRCTVPLAPPPSAPLPDLPPPSPTARYGCSLMPPTSMVPVPRQPLLERSLHIENVGDTFSPTSPFALLPSPNYAQNDPLITPQGLIDADDDIADEVMKEY